MFGGAFTALPRIENAEDAVTPEGSLTAAAEARVRDFAAALRREPKSERLRFANDFLSRRGVAVQDRQRVLAASLGRFASEQRVYQDTLAAAGKSGDRGELLFARSTLYRDRGLSVDTSLLPNFAIEDTLRVMLRKGSLTAGAIRRVAIVGPGLDFADKRGGYDYYPLQTIQPFAIFEAVVRLDLGAADDVELTAFDLNSAVIEHVREAAKRARDIPT